MQKQTFTRRFGPTLVAAGLYVAISIAAYWPVGPFDRSRVPTCACWDVTYSIWFIGWTAHAVAHGLNPFFSMAVNYPFGANIAANPSSPILEFLTTPLTLLDSPVASFNLLMHLALASSGFAMFWVLTRLGIRWFAALVGGLLYGFSAYEQAHSTLWLNLSFVALIPLLFFTFERLWHGPRHPGRLGVVLGLLAGAQYLISSELLVDATLILAVACLSVLIVRPRIVQMAWPELRKGGLVALAIFVVIVAIPVVYLLFGRQHFNGPGYSVSALSAVSNDLLGPVVPTKYQLVGPSNWLARGTSFLASYPAESGLYLGIPLIVIIVVFTVLGRRRRLIVLSSWLTFVAFVLSLGPTLSANGHSTHLWLPFKLITRIPLLEMEVPARYSLFVQLFASFVLASAIDELLNRVRQPSSVLHPTPRQRNFAWRYRYLLAAIALFFFAVAPLIPRWPMSSASVSVPRILTLPELRKIPPGSVLLAYPYPALQDDRAMLWQAVSGFRFNLIGGYVYTPLRHVSGTLDNGGGGFFPRTLDPSAIEVLFYDGYLLSSGWHFPGNDLALERDFLLRYHVSTIVLDPVGQYPNKVAAYLARALRTQPLVSGGIESWSHVQLDLSQVHKPTNTLVNHVRTRSLTQ